MHTLMDALMYAMVARCVYVFVLLYVTWPKYVFNIGAPQPPSHIMMNVNGSSAMAMLQLFSDGFQCEMPELLAMHDPSVLADDISICATAAGMPKIHPPLVQDDQVFDYASSYSSASHWLERKEWYKLDVHVDFSGGRLENSSEPIMFHGTEWGSALKIIDECQGFIVGPGTHRVRNRALAGCWCVPGLGEAIRRSNPNRYVFRGDFTRMCCPVALEIQAVNLRRVPRTDKFCAAAPIGSVHDGLLIRAIHFNTRFMKNYLKLEEPVIRHRLIADSFHCRRCACGWCGQVCLPDSPAFWHWPKSRNSQYYTPRCCKLITANCIAYL